MGFEEWLHVNLPSMLRLATVLCGSPQSAEDLVQDVLIKAHGRWERIQLFDHPDAYLRRMLINEHVSWRRRVASALRRDTFTTAQSVDRGRPFDEEWVDRVELVGEIQKLAPKQQAVIVLRYLDDFTIAETALALGCTESTVRAYTSRALASLRVALPADEAPTNERLPSASSRRPHLVRDRHAQ